MAVTVSYNEGSPVPQLNYSAGPSLNGRSDARRALQGIYDTNESNVAIANANNIAQYHMFQEANDYNTMMWEREQDYNLPIRQVQRLLDAGINPRVGIQGGNSGNATSSPSSAPTPNFHSPEIIPPTDAYRISQDSKFQTLAAIGNVVGQANDTLTSAAQSRLANSQASLNEVDALTRLAQNRASIENMLKNSKYLGSAADLAESQKNALEKTTPANVRIAENTAAGIALDNDAKTLQNEIQQKYGMLMKDAELRSILSDVTVKLSQSEVNYANSDYIKATTNQVAYQIQNLIKTGRLLDAQTESVEAGTELTKEQTKTQQYITSKTKWDSMSAKTQWSISYQIADDLVQQAVLTTDFLRLKGINLQKQNDFLNDQRDWYNLNQGADYMIYKPLKAIGSFGGFGFPQSGNSVGSSYNGWNSSPSYHY